MVDETFQLNCPTIRGLYGLKSRGGECLEKKSLGFNKTPAFWEYASNSMELESHLHVSRQSPNVSSRPMQLLKLPGLQVQIVG